MVIESFVEFFFFIIIYKQFFFVVEQEVYFSFFVYESVLVEVFNFEGYGYVQ